MKNYTFITAMLLLIACDSRPGNNSQYTIASRGINNNTRNEGKTIFQQNCASCHNLMKESTGPALSRDLIQDRSDDWIFTLITDQKHLKKDAAYKKRIKTYGSSCPQIPISKEKLKLLISYIRNPSIGCM